MTPTFTFDRPVTDDERSLNTHINMWGSSGYPVRKAGRLWTWDYRTLHAPTLYRTKREATEALERYLAVIHSCLAAESYRRTVTEQFAREACT